MRKYIGVTVIAVLAVAALVLLIVGKNVHRDMEVKAYFRNARGLQTGAPVRLAGVEVGRVTGVAVRPELRENPAEITLSLRTSPDFKVPSDAAVTIETAGVLGPSFAQIDVSKAYGPQVENGGVLRGIDVPQVSIEELLERITELMKRKDCDAATKAGTQPRR